jgi:hypothetical protein
MIASSIRLAARRLPAAPDHVSMSAWFYDLPYDFGRFFRPLHSAPADEQNARIAVAFPRLEGRVASRLESAGESSERGWARGAKTCSAETRSSWFTENPVGESRRGSRVSANIYGPFSACRPRRRALCSAAHLLLTKSNPKVAVDAQEQPSRTLELSGLHQPVG